MYQENRSWKSQCCGVVASLFAVCNNCTASYNKVIAMIVLNLELKNCETAWRNRNPMVRFSSGLHGSNAILCLRLRRRFTFISLHELRMSWYILNRQLSNDGLQNLMTNTITLAIFVQLTRQRHCTVTLILRYLIATRLYTVLWMTLIYCNTHCVDSSMPNTLTLLLIYALRCLQQQTLEIPIT